MKSSFRRRVLASVLAGALVAGCSAEKTPDQLLASARASLSKGDARTAFIELKNVLNQRQDSGEARLLLGQALLAMGQPQDAAVELRKAAALGQPAALVTPLLARALLIQQQYQRLVDEFAQVTLPDPAAAADLQATLANAYLSLGNLGAAQKAGDVALRQVPDHPRTLLMQARAAAGQRRFEDALKLIDKAVAGDPNEVDAWLYRGDALVAGRGDAKGGMDAYRKALAIDSRNIAARSNLMVLLIAEGNLKAADEELVQLSKMEPLPLQARYFQAQLALLRGDTKRAAEEMQQVIGAAPDNVRALNLAGQIALANNALAEAERSFNKALTIAPDSQAARQSLARTYLRMGQGIKAIAAAGPLLAAPGGNARAEALTAEAYMQIGDFAKATPHFSRAVELDPKDVRSRVALALVEFNKGSVDSAISELQAMATSDSSTFPDLALVNALLQKRDLPRALVAVDAMEKKTPGKASTADLRGRVLLLQNQVAEARKAFERAIAIDPVWIPAVISLARLDVADKQPAAARKRFDTVLTADPVNLPALMGIVALRRSEGAPPQEIADLLRNAIRLNPGEAAPRIQLVENLLSVRDTKAGLTTAIEADSAIPDNMDVLDVLGRTQAMVGEQNQALSTFKKMAALEPRSTLALLRMASIYLTWRDFDGAGQAFRRVLEIDPGLAAAQEGLVEAALAAGRPAEALAAAQEFQKQRPDGPLGHELEARVHVQQKRMGAAVEAYRVALTKAPLALIATKLHAALLADGKPADAQKLATTWLAEHPKDLEFLAYVGDSAMARKDFGAAENHFKRFLELQPDNPLALNNVAWLLVQQGKPGAVPYAERADKLRPNAPGLMDTLATALAAEGQLKRAIDIEKRAVAIAPSNPGLRLTLAKLYIQSGEAVPARAELEALAKLGPRFEAQAEVAQLLRSL